MRGGGLPSCRVTPGSTAPTSYTLLHRYLPWGGATGRTGAARNAICFVPAGAVNRPVGMSTLTCGACSALARLAAPAVALDHRHGRGWPSSGSSSSSRRWVRRRIGRAGRGSRRRRTAAAPTCGATHQPSPSSASATSTMRWRPHRSHQPARSANACASAGAVTDPVVARSAPSHTPTARSSGTTPQP